jgi:hypothetical protein
MADTPGNPAQAAAEPLPFAPCASQETVTVDALSATGGVIDGDVLEVPIGGNVTLNVTVTPHQSVASMPGKMTSTILGVPVTLVTQDFAGSFPLPADSSSTISMPLSSQNLPQIVTTVRLRGWENQESTDADAAFCVEFRLRIVASP